ncbi:Rho GTPase activation protein [Gongronella butleri]|nr:Rho GTPase activation protein [Gongronella butleri]
MPTPVTDTSSIASSSSSSSSSAFSFDDQTAPAPLTAAVRSPPPPPPPPSAPSSSVFSKFATMRSKVEQKTTELNATVQERLPEWRSRGAMYSNMARETGLEWGRKGKEAVDRWREQQTQQRAAKQDEQLCIFGLPLDQAIVFTSLSDDDPIPGILRRCIDYLDVHGIQEVGLYRVPGSSSTVNKLKSIFNPGGDCDFFTTFPDTNAVAALLKMYLRELPDQVIPAALHEQFKSYLTAYTQKHPQQDGSELPPITDELLDAMRQLTAQMPATSHYLLHCLARHLHRIAANNDKNKMSTSNLALIFIPTLGISRLLFHCMIDYPHRIFAASSAAAAMSAIASIHPPGTSTISPGTSTISPGNATTTTATKLTKLPTTTLTMRAESPLSFSSSSTTSAGPTSPRSPRKQSPPPLPAKPKGIIPTNSAASSCNSGASQSSTSAVPAKPMRHRPFNRSIDLAIMDRMSPTLQQQQLHPPQPQQSQQQHTKTLSDTDILKLTKATPSSSSLPPPKPARSPSKASNTENKPRSKSLSSPTSHPLLKVTTSSFSTRRARSGSRVEALGRQFEQLMSPPSPSSPKHGD